MVPQVPLRVYEVATSSVCVRHDDGTQDTRYAAFLVWADLAPLLPYLSDKSGPQILAIETAAYCSDPSQIMLLGRPNPESDQHEGVQPGPPLTTAQPPTFTLTLPSAAVAIVTATDHSPLMIRLAVIDGPPPENPSGYIAPYTEIDLLLTFRADATRDALLSSGYAPAQTVPFMEHDGSSDLALINDNRLLLWPILCGLALGQTAAMNSLLGLIDFAVRAFTAEAIADNGEHCGRYEALCEVFDVSLARSKHALDVHSHAEPPVLNALPRTLTPALPRFTDDNLATAWDSLDGEVAFAECAMLLGFPACLAAGTLLLASRAIAMAEQPATQEPSASCLLSLWMSMDDEGPRWVLPLTAPLLAHYDLEVLVNLLASTSDSEPSGMLNDYVHATLDALNSVNTGTVDVLTALRRAPLQPTNIADVIALTDMMLLDRGDPDTCPVCAAVDALRHRDWDMTRIARASATLLPILADLDADFSGLAIGEADWVAHRGKYLTHWLTEAAHEFT